MTWVLGAAMRQDLGHQPDKITVAKVVVVCVLIICAYVAWLAYSGSTEQSAPVAQSQAIEKSFYAIRKANVRASPNLTAKIVGQKERGEKMVGFVETNADKERHWLKLSDNSGYVSLKLLSADPRPRIDEYWGQKYYFTVDADIRAAPDPKAISLGKGGEGAYFAIGRTGDWVEILTNDGGVAYISKDSVLYEDLMSPVGTDVGTQNYTPVTSSTPLAGNDTCSGSIDGRWMYCGVNATVCANSVKGNHVACGGRATICSNSIDGSSVACGGKATICTSSLNGNDVACGGLATICTSSLNGNDVACGGYATICTSSLNGNDVACGGYASICTTSLNGNDAACGGNATGCTTSLNGTRACGDGRYSAD